MTGQLPPRGTRWPERHCSATPTPAICGGLYDAAGQLYQHFFGDRPRGVNQAKISKCLYLLRPGLIPVLDSRLVTLYRQASRTAARTLAARCAGRPAMRRAYWAAVRHDLLRAADTLTLLRDWMRSTASGGVVAEAAERLSDVRLLDILAWSSAGHRPAATGAHRHARGRAAPMIGKYHPLTDYLCVAAGSGRPVVEMTFDEIADLVGGLPPSITQRQWWANTDHPQAKAWTAANYRVEQVYLDRSRVRFTLGSPTTVVVTTPAPAATVASPPVTAGSGPAGTGPPGDVRVVLHWQDIGPVVLDSAGMLSFPALRLFPACTG